MSTTLSDTKVPFLLKFVREVDPAVYRSAVTTSDALGNTYDPESQTSAEGWSMAGTSRTIERTTTDWTIRTDDSRTVDD
jgi:hypothetical protein